MLKRLVAGVAIVCSLTSNTVLAEIDLELSGEITQGSLVIGKTNVHNKVMLNEQNLKLSPHGYFAFGFSRDEVSEHNLVITNNDGETVTRKLTPTTREYRIQRVEGISKKIMNPDPKAIERSRKDSKQIKAVRAVASDRIDFAHGFKAPAKGRITGVYGSQRVYNGEPKNPHFGLDYAGPTGTPVLAPAAGVITLWVPDMFYSGGTLVIDHGHGVTSTFLHLSASNVSVGDTVLQGQEIAKIGSTGRSTGPHLDWRINWHNMRLDPALALGLKNFHTFSK